MKNVLVTGANRGIGLEFVRQLAAGFRPDTANIIATCRDPEKAQELNAIKNSSKVKVQVLKIDVTKKEDIESLLPSVQKLLGPNQGLNLLINNAGYGPKVSLDEITQDEMEKVMSINTVAPVMVVKALLPLLRMSADQSKESGLSCSKSAVVNISSQLGTFQVPVPSGPEGAAFRLFMTYSASKAALDMCMRYVAAETLPWNVLVLLIHPGWVKTDMGTSAAPLTTQESVSSMLSTIVSMNENHHGKLFDKDGQIMNW